MYTFSKVSTDFIPKGTSKIMDVDDMTPDEQCLTIGKIKTLFGDPNYVTKNNENLYSYTICVKKEDEIVTYLELYHGPSGNSIGGNQSNDCKMAACELVELIHSAKPSDYKLISLYNDFNLLIKMEIKNGLPKCKSIYIPGLALFYYKGKDICKIIIIILILLNLYFLFK